MNDLITIEEILKWYENNVKPSINQEFIEKLIRIGILYNDSDDDTFSLNKLNNILLEQYDGKYINEDGFNKIKKNRLQLINNKQIENVNLIPNNTKIQKQPKKLFKIERTSNNKLKLIKLK